MKVVSVAALTAILCGCSAGDQIAFQPSVGQQAIVRDGVAALQSNGQNSILIARPASREVNPSGRPIFALGLVNLSGQPLDFRIADVTVQRTEKGRAVETLDVKTYEELVKEERRDQIIGGVLAVLAASANSISASNAGYGTANTTFYGPNGTYTARTTIYSPAAASIAQSHANMQNAAMFNSLAQEGHANLSSLEQTVIKDNTLMPGEDRVP